MSDDARGFFDRMSEVARERKRAMDLLEYGPPRSSGRAGGISDPTFGRSASNEDARTALARADAEIAEALDVISGLRMVYARKADVLELRYIELRDWEGIAGKLGVSRRTAMSWRDQLLDWCDLVGIARAKAGIGIAEDETWYTEATATRVDGEIHERRERPDTTGEER